MARVVFHEDIEGRTMINSMPFDPKPRPDEPEEDDADDPDYDDGFRDEEEGDE
jgi:hypothetical protein